VPRGGQARIAHLLLLVSLVANPNADAVRFMLTTILAYVIAATGLAPILAGAWSFVMLAIQDERDRPFEHYAIAIAIVAVALRAQYARRYGGAPTAAGQWTQYA